MSPKPAASQASESKRHKFLLGLRSGFTVTKAAEQAGAARNTFYDWRDQSPSFRKDWEDAVAASNEVLLDEVRERALDRKDQRSYLLLMFLVKSKFPEFKESHKPTPERSDDDVKEFAFSKEEVDKALEILTNAQNQSEPTQ